MKTIEKALVAIAESRLEARTSFGYATLSRPTPKQLAVIAMADFSASESAMEDCTLALAGMEKQPLGTYLFMCEGGFSHLQILKEVRSFLYA